MFHDQQQVLYHALETRTVLTVFVVVVVVVVVVAHRRASLRFCTCATGCRKLDESSIEVIEASLYRCIYRLFQIIQTFVHRIIYRSCESVQSLRRHCIQVFLHSVEGAFDGVFHVVHVSFRRSVGILFGMCPRGTSYVP